MSQTVLQMREQGNGSSQVTNVQDHECKAVTSGISLHYVLTGCPSPPPLAFSKQTYLHIGILFLCQISDMRNDISKQRMDSVFGDSLKLGIYSKTTYLCNEREKSNKKLEMYSALEPLAHHIQLSW